MLETLESRRLFTGLTILTHGYEGNITGWIATAATDIQQRYGGSKYASIYSMVVSQSGKSLVVTSFGPDSGQPDYKTTLDGEMILKLDWSSVSAGLVTTQSVAAVVYQYLLVKHGKIPPLAEYPMQLIGHSRGASLMTALSQDLGKSGIFVDQQTNLDPHPVDGVDDFLGADFGDQKMATYSNVAFSDTYWRTDGNPNNLDFDGEPVAGSFNSELTVVQDNFIGSAHIAVTAYYVGTINTTSLNGGDHPVLPVWYPGTKAAPARTKTGYAFSTEGGLSQPLSGVSTLLGGTGKRTDPGESGAQWANTFGLNTRKVTTVAAGTTLSARFFVSDRDSSERVDVYIDQDQNPEDGVSLLTGKTFAANALGTGKLGVPTTGLKAGSYYLATLATDSTGHARWEYSTYKITITAPASLKANVLALNKTTPALTTTAMLSADQHLTGFLASDTLAGSEAMDLLE